MKKLKIAKDEHSNGDIDYYHNKKLVLWVDWSSYSYDKEVIIYYSLRDIADERGSTLVRRIL